MESMGWRWGSAVVMVGMLLVAASPLPGPRLNTQRDAIPQNGIPQNDILQSAPPQPGEIVINEILYAPSPSDAEFIELLNRSDRTLDLGMLTYADGNDDFDPVAPPGTLLDPGAIVVLTRTSDAFATRFPNVPHRTPPGWDALNNGGDLVQLRANGVIIDAVAYEGDAAPRDVSLERVDPAAPSSLPSTFAPSTDPAGATPGAVNSVYAPDTTPPTAVFAEATDPARVRVTFSEPVRPDDLVPSTFGIGSVAPVQVVPAGSPKGLAAVLDFAETLSASRLEIGPLTDRVGNRSDPMDLPIAVPPAPGDLVFTEVHYEPLADDADGRPNQPEYVELYNRSDRAVSLRGLHLTDRPDETGAADTLRAGRPQVLPAGGYLVVASRAGRVPGDSALTRAYPAGVGPEAAVLPVDAASLGLRNDGALVRVHRADGVVIDSVAYVPDWHAADLRETRGTSLARRSATAPTQDPATWTSSAHPDGGTPGRANQVGLADRPAGNAPNGNALTVTVQPSPFSIARDGATRIAYRLTEGAGTLRIRIYDAQGRPVRTLAAAGLAMRDGELLWDGRNDDGHPVRMGLYVVLVDVVRPEDGSVDRAKVPVVVATGR